MFSKTEIAEACQHWGSHLWVPAGVNGATLLWAVAGCESSFGANCAPRHEPYYHDLAIEGKNEQLVKLTEQFGCAAHSSFGPWQELLVNCMPPASPEDFARIDFCALQTTMFINHRILKQEQAQTVEEIAEAYNSGKWAWKEVPAGAQRYAQQCRQYYDAGIPA